MWSADLKIQGDTVEKSIEYLFRRVSKIGRASTAHGTSRWLIRFLRECKKSSAKTWRREAIFHPHFESAVLHGFLFLFEAQAFYQTDRMFRSTRECRWALPPQRRRRRRLRRLVRPFPDSFSYSFYALSRFFTRDPTDARPVQNEGEETVCPRLQSSASLCESFALHELTATLVWIKRNERFYNIMI